VKTYTAAQVREAEAPALAAGVPLMARASAALADETAALLRERRHAVIDPVSGPAVPAEGLIAGARIVVLAGAGDNGGDALHAGALLAVRGALVTIVPTAQRMHEAGLAAARVAGARLLSLSESADELTSAVVAAATGADVILDGILGTGTSENPALRGRARLVVAALLPLVHGGGPAVVAVDIPSGIGPDRGEVPDSTVLPATLTVTFGGCKAGLLRAPASRFVGRLVVVDIGICAELERIAARDRRTLDHDTE